MHPFSITNRSQYSQYIHVEISNRFLQRKHKTETRLNIKHFRPLLTDWMLWPVVVLWHSHRNLVNQSGVKDKASRCVCIESIEWQPFWGSSWLDKWKYRRRVLFSLINSGFFNKNRIEIAIAVTSCINFCRSSWFFPMQIEILRIARDNQRCARNGKNNDDVQRIYVNIIASCVVFVTRFIVTNCRWDKTLPTGIPYLYYS